MTARDDATKTPSEDDMRELLLGCLLVGLLAACGGDEAPEECEPTEGNPILPADGGNASQGGAGGSASGGTSGAGGDGGSGGQPSNWEIFSEGLTGGPVNDVLYDPRNANILWALARSGLFKSVDSGETWSFVHEMVGNVIAIPNEPSVLYIGTNDGVYRTEDNGATFDLWSLDGLSISDLAIAWSDSRRLYASIGGVGIVRSFDGGDTWGSANSGVPFSNVLSLSIHPTDPNDVVASLTPLDQDYVTQTASSLLRTTNGGGSWTTTQSIVGTNGVVARCPTSPELMLAGTGFGGTWRSSDGGATWSILASPGHNVVAITFAPSDCNTAYASAFGLGTKVSSDGGLTFSPPQANGVSFASKTGHHLAVDPTDPNRLFNGGAQGLLLTEDRAQNFNLVEVPMGFDSRALHTNSNNPEEVWLVTWGQGAWSKEASLPWVGNQQFSYYFTVESSPGGQLWFGASGVFTSTDGVTLTLSSSEAVNPLSIAAPTDTTVYAATQQGGVYKTTNAGATWAPQNTGLPTWSAQSLNGILTRAILTDVNDVSRVYLGTSGRGLFVSENGGDLWQPLALPEARVACLAQMNNGDLLACVETLGVLKSSDGGLNWAPVNDGLGSLAASRIYVDRASGDVFGTAGGRIYTLQGNAWTLVGESDALGAGARGPITVMQENGDRYLVTSSTSGAILRFKLD